MTKSTFNHNAAFYWDKNISVCPIIPGEKASIKGWNNYIDQIPTLKTREAWLADYAD